MSLFAWRMVETRADIKIRFNFHQAELVASFANEAFTLVAYIDIYDDPIDRKMLNAIAQKNYLGLWEGLLGKLVRRHDS